MVCIHRHTVQRRARVAEKKLVAKKLPLRAKGEFFSQVQVASHLLLVLLYARFQLA